MTTSASAAPAVRDDDPADDEGFWDDLLGHVQDGVLIPVTGPGLTTVAVDGTCRTLSEHIAARLVAEYGLDVSPRMTMGDAAAAFIRTRGRQRARQLYRIVSDIIRQVENQDEPCRSLHDLAAITDLRLFVSTTPDRLLAKALNDVRFGGEGGTRELTFSLSQSTGEQASNLKASAKSETTVVRLFGEVASTPQYALHDEDLLEWLRALLTESERLPGWIADAIRQQPLLFLGCDIPVSYTHLTLPTN